MNNEPVKAEAPELEASVSVSTEAEAPVAEAPVRDFKAEAEALLKDFPEIKENYISEEAFGRMVNSEKPMSEAYRDYLYEKTVEENKDLKSQLAVAKQNLEAATKAPVTSVSDGGSTESPFAGNPILAGLFGE